MEKIELRNHLMRSLDRFLTDCAVRYRNLKSEFVMPSLYSYSGERRFYYDLRRTRWGLRLHISQVTDMHRNVIGIPLEALVSFRNRLNEAITVLRLDDQDALAKKAANAQRRRKRNLTNRRGVGATGGRRKRGGKPASDKSGGEGEGGDTAAEDDKGPAADVKVEKEEKVANGEATIEADLPAVAVVN
jgi:hypothetical protein